MGGWHYIKLLNIMKNEPTWNTLLEKLNEKSNPYMLHWFSSLKLVSHDDKTVTLESKSDFGKYWIENHYMDLINETVEEVWMGKREVILITKSKSSNSNHTRTDESSISNNKKKHKDPYRSAVSLANSQEHNLINPIYTFNNFIVGPSNRFAHAASFAVSQKPGESYNPLFIYGRVGLGKTHLINAIANYVLNNGSHNRHRICSTSAESFTNQVINSIRTNKMDDLRNRFRSACDILLIDDIQFIAGKESTQEEFFHTFNTLYGSKKQIVLTSDKSPQETPQLEERLRSRFEWGLIADIQPPEIETRIAILTQKAESRGVEFPSEVAVYLADNTKSNVRELEGVFNNLIGQSQLMDQKITLDLAKQVLKSFVNKQERQILSIETILKEVATYFRIEISLIKSNKKQKNVAIARQVAMYLARKLTSESFLDIGEKIGGKDHSTVIHAVKKIEGLYNSDIFITNAINDLSRKLVPVG